MLVGGGTVSRPATDGLLSYQGTMTPAHVMPALDVGIRAASL